MLLLLRNVSDYTCFFVWNVSILKWEWRWYATKKVMRTQKTAWNDVILEEEVEPV